LILSNLHNLYLTFDIFPATQMSALPPTYEEVLWSLWHHRCA